MTTHDDLSEQAEPVFGDWPDATRVVVGGLIVFFMGLAAYGVWKGNVFENYQNGSNL